jgi:UV DNA damage endonuclease
MIKLGLTCISEQLKELDKKKYSFQTMTRKRFNDLCERDGREETVKELSERIYNNIIVTQSIIVHCIKKGIAHYRLSSSLFPLLTDPTLGLSLEELPNIGHIKRELAWIKSLAGNDLSIGSHPDQFVVLASQNNDAVKNSINELNFQSRIFDMIGLPQDHSAPMNLHINCSPKNIHGKADGDYFTKLVEEVADRFFENLMCCDEGVINRLTVEVEDKGHWSVANILLFNQVMNNKYDLNIPICYDQLHDLCNPSGAQMYADKYTTIQDHARLCKATWPDGITPVFHWSEGKPEKPRAHADYVADGNYPVDVGVIWEIECKAKDRAIARLKEQMAMAEVSKKDLTESKKPSCLTA